MLLEWNEIESVADCAFNVWVGTPEREWAKSMWLLLEKQDLTSYEDDFEWHRAVFRFLALGGIYRDYCAVAWDEHTDRWYWDWVDSIEIKPFILGQLYGRETTEDYDDELSNVLSVLVELERSKVVVALSEGLGGDLELYLSLSMSRSTAVDPDEEGAGDSESDHLEPTGRNSNALFWVQEGCPTYLSE